ncbi:MAG: hypothetical protein KDA88_23875, partial [Planctomycetaceae bacterium]|nr:hypothetical protein [Planctomycetaceae bacterium]
MNSNSDTSPRIDQSDSGPLGLQLRDAAGLVDHEELDELWDTTKVAIAAEGLRDLKRVDRGGYGVVCRAIDERTGNPRAIKVVLHPKRKERFATFV